MLKKDIVNKDTGATTGIHRVMRLITNFFTDGSAASEVTVGSFLTEDNRAPLLSEEVRIASAPAPNQTAKDFAEAVAVADEKWQGALIVPDKIVAPVEEANVDIDSLVAEDH